MSKKTKLILPRNPNTGHTIYHNIPKWKLFLWYNLGFSFSPYRGMRTGVYKIWFYSGKVALGSFTSHLLLTNNDPDDFAWTCIGDIPDSTSTSEIRKVKYLGNE